MTPQKPLSDQAIALWRAVSRHPTPRRIVYVQRKAVCFLCHCSIADVPEIVNELHEAGIVRWQGYIRHNGAWHVSLRVVCRMLEPGRLVMAAGDGVDKGGQQ